MYVLDARLPRWAFNSNGTHNVQHRRVDNESRRWSSFKKYIIDHKSTGDDAFSMFLHRKIWKLCSCDPIPVMKSVLVTPTQISLRCFVQKIWTVFNVLRESILNAQMNRTCKYCGRSDDGCRCCCYNIETECSLVERSIHHFAVVLISFVVQRKLCNIVCAFSGAQSRLQTKAPIKFDLWFAFAILTKREKTKCELFASSSIREHRRRTHDVCRLCSSLLFRSRSTNGVGDPPFSLQTLIWFGKATGSYSIFTFRKYGNLFSMTLCCLSSILMNLFRTTMKSKQKRTKKTKTKKKRETAVCGAPSKWPASEFDLTE